MNDFNDGDFLNILTDYTLQEVLDILITESQLIEAFRSQWTNGLDYISDNGFGDIFLSYLEKYSIEDYTPNDALNKFVNMIQSEMVYHVAAGPKLFLADDLDQERTDSIDQAYKFNWAEANDASQLDDAYTIVRRHEGGYIQVKPGTMYLF